MTSCGGGKGKGTNPFFEEWDTPFGVPPFDEIRAEHFEPAFDRAMSLHEAEIDAITTNNDDPSFANTIEAFDASGRMLATVSDVFWLISSAQTDKQIQKIEERMASRLAAHYDGILMNEKLFGRIKRLYDIRENLDLDSVQMRLLTKTYESFVRSGALLDKEQKERLKEINEDLAAAEVKFGNNILAENNSFKLELSLEDLDGIPASIRDAAKERAKGMGIDDKYVFTLHTPSMIPFLTNSSRRDLREQLYKAYINRCNNGDGFDNKETINEIMRLRTEKAHLLGYGSYAEYVTADEMAATPENVYALLDGIWGPALDKAKDELAQMTELFREDFPEESDPFESWDWWYYAEKLRKKNYSINEETIRSFFSLDNVRQGVFNLANRLYGLTFRPVVVPLYNPEVSAYEVIDADESHLGVLYFDFFPRESKRQGAWCQYIRRPKYEDGVRTAPVVGIVCNFPRPTEATPSLLTLDEVRTIFHEFGHALHFIFSNVRYDGLLDVEGDFVELPSQIMENWALEPEMLKTYAINYRSNEVISDYLIGKIEKSSSFNQGFATTELVAAALTDMDIHSLKEFRELDVDAFEYDALYERRGMIPQIEPRYHYTYFAHIFAGGYSAGYYFYLWAEVLDKDAFEAFRESGDRFNRKIAASFRREILSRGGEADGMTLYRNFRGADPDRRPMLRARGLLKEEPADSTAVDTGLEPISDKKASIEFGEPLE